MTTKKRQTTCKYCGDPLPPRAQIQCATCRAVKDEAHLQGFYDEVVALMDTLALKSMTSRDLHDEVARQFPAVEPRLFALRKSAGETVDPAVQRAIDEFDGMFQSAIAGSIWETEWHEQAQLLHDRTLQLIRELVPVQKMPKLSRITQKALTDGRTFLSAVWMPGKANVFIILEVVHYPTGLFKWDWSGQIAEHEKHGKTSVLNDLIQFFRQYGDFGDYGKET